MISRALVLAALLAAGPELAGAMPPASTSAVLDTAIRTPLELELFRAGVRYRTRAATTAVDLEACRAELRVRTPAAVRALTPVPPAPPAPGVPPLATEILVIATITGVLGAFAAGIEIGRHGWPW